MNFRKQILPRDYSGATVTSSEIRARELLNNVIGPNLESLLDVALNPFSPVKTELLERQHPRINAYVKDGAMMVDLCVPYYTKENISVESDAVNHAITVAGTATQDTNVGDVYHIRQISRGSFRRSLQFSADYDVDKVSAELQDGILRLSVPPVKPAETVKTKKVKIL
jgi:HSP20 family protein